MNLKILSGRMDFSTMSSQCFLKLGDLFYYKHFGKYFYFLAHPEMVKYVLHENPGNFPKSTNDFLPTHIKYLKYHMGNGLTTTDGKTWLEDRKFLNHEFVGSKIAKFDSLITQVILTICEELLEKARQGVTFDLWTITKKLSLAAIGQIIFSADLNEDGESIRHALDLFTKDFKKRSTSLVPSPSIPSPWNVRFIFSRRHIHQTIKRHYRKRMSNKDLSSDILSLLIEFTGVKNGSPRNYLKLRDQLMTLILAGYETTASSLAWTFYLIATHPEVEERLLVEFEKILSGTLPTSEKVKKLSFTQMVIKESMRLFPPVWGIIRSCIKPDRIGGYYIRGRSEIITSLHALHRHRGFWENPDEFHPDRFQPSNKSRISQFAYLPFGYGGHTCLGRELAMLEMSLAVAIILQKFKIKISPNARIVKEAVVSTQPRYGIEVSIEPR